MSKLKSKKSLISLFVCLVLLVGSVFVTTTAKSSSSTITVHYKGDFSNPKIYYWNALPKNQEVDWPGEDMDEDSDGWFTYTFKNATKINLLFNDGNGNQTEDLTANSSEWWYKDGKWTDEDPTSGDSGEDKPGTGGSEAGSTTGSQLTDRTDFREETIYFVMTTRFYDGYKDNNLHCWDEDTSMKKTEGDPAWRGDFKGLIEKLDYIKALGFSAIWITPVVENASGLDYHGYHAINFSKVDPRYESPGATYQDLIDACHKKGLKIIQDIVYNHTGNWGEENLLKTFKKKDTGLESAETCMVPTAESLGTAEEYFSQKPGIQYDKRLALLKNTDGVNHDTNYIYHHYGNFNWDEYDSQLAQIAGDCVDLNTENPKVTNYLNDCYKKYISMGVDGFRVDTVKHISRLTWNESILPELTKAGGDNFYMFGEVCTRDRNYWYRNTPGLSAPFYTWKESKEYPWSDDPENNIKLTEEEFNDNADIESQPTSDNAFLNGNDYHTPDRSKFSGMNVIDFPMHWNFKNARDAFSVALAGDHSYNDPTWNVTYVDSHDYAPDCAPEGERFNQDQKVWAENLNLMFTFRGIPCIYYGSEIEFKKGKNIDPANQKTTFEESGRAYYGENLEGDVTATDFGEYTASGTVAETLKHPLAQHIIRLNKIRRAIPALQKGQYSTEGVSGDGMAYKRRYTDNKTDSFVCVSVSGGATFTGVPAGKYVDAITGDTINSDGTLTIPAIEQGNMRVYVLNGTGKIGEDGTYLK